jgi:site-specific DNA-methyltransferase (adenine-specific)
MNKLVANKDKHQWFTPVFAAARLIEFHFPDLTEDDMIVEPTCGSGNFLKALPDHVPAYGVELDPEIAMIARQSTGRHVVTGDSLQTRHI